MKGFDILGVRYDVWRDGCWREARGNLEQVLALCALGKVRPLVSTSFLLSRAVDAMSSITSRQVTGKVVLTA